jgi:2-(1,2-epoxy-1,2-dihydrophenyl)acetyl-CoA isomerase
MADLIESDLREGVLHVRLNRPEKLNAINDAILDGLLSVTEQGRRDAKVGAVVLSGRGRAFSAGGDIQAMEAMDEPAFRDTISRYMRLAHAFQSLPKPIIAALHGHVLAGGFELAVISDLRIAAEGTVLGLPDAALGLSPTSGLTWLLPRIVGLGRALQLTLSGETITAEEARSIGLVAKVVPAETLIEDAHGLAKAIADCPKVGVGATKTLFYHALTADFATATAAEEKAELECFRAPETRRRFQAFIARKKGRSPAK